MSHPNCDGKGKILVNPVNSEPVLVKCAECGGNSKAPPELTGYAQKIVDAYAAQCEFHIAKNKSYGDSVFKPNEFGQSPETLIKARIADKIARLKALTADGKTEAVGESIDDTITDMIGYLVCWKIVRKEAGK